MFSCLIVEQIIKLIFLYYIIGTNNQSFFFAIFKSIFQFLKKIQYIFLVFSMHNWQKMENRWADIIIEVMWRQNLLKHLFYSIYILYIFFFSNYIHFNLFRFIFIFVWWYFFKRQRQITYICVESKIVYYYIKNFFLKIHNKLIGKLPYFSIDKCIY